jgi:hypothetical protein
MPMLIPCSMPNRKNAVTTENTVKIVRTFFRHRPAHTNVKYFIDRSVHPAAFWRYPWTRAAKARTSKDAHH